LGTHVTVALALLVITAGFSYASFSSYLIQSRSSQLVDRGNQLARVLAGYFSNRISPPTADYLLEGLEGALNAHVVVVDPSGTVILSGGRSETPALTITPAILKTVLVRRHDWNQEVPGSSGMLLGVGVPIPVGKTIVGAIFLDEPVSPLTATAGSLLVRVLLGGLVGAAAAALLAALVSRTFARPLSAMHQAAGLVAAGDLNVRVVPAGPREVAELGERFNAMAKSLQDRVADLRRDADLRDELLAHVAHDLKTPLTTVRGYLEAILDGVVAGPQAERAVHVAHQETLRLQRLTARLLEAAQLEAELASHREPVAVRAWAEEVSQRFTGARPEAPAVVVEGDKDAVAWAHRDAMTEVLVNLLDNASHFHTGSDPIRVQVSRRFEEVEVAVSDHGPGIPPEIYDYVFEPFVTGDPARTGRGTGLGLSIARRLIMAMGGSVGADPGGPAAVGARVWFRVPAPFAVARMDGHRGQDPSGG